MLPATVWHSNTLQSPWGHGARWKIFHPSIYWHNSRNEIDAISWPIFWYKWNFSKEVSAVENWTKMKNQRDCIWSLRAPSEGKQQRIGLYVKIERRPPFSVPRYHNRRDLNLGLKTFSLPRQWYRHLVGLLFCSRRSLQSAPLGFNIQSLSSDLHPIHERKRIFTFAKDTYLIVPLSGVNTRHGRNTTSENLGDGQQFKAQPDKTKEIVIRAGRM